MADKQERVPDEQHRQALLCEYPVLGESWKFLVGLRFAFIAFSVTLVSMLFGGYRAVLEHMDDAHAFGRPALFVLSLIGLVSAAIIGFIEEHTREMCAECLRRGMQIEEYFGSHAEGHFYRLWWTPAIRKIGSHRTGLRTLYGLLIFVWLCLALRSLIA